MNATEMKKKNIYITYLVVVIIIIIVRQTNQLEINHRIKTYLNASEEEEEEKNSYTKLLLYSTYI
jgi:hypothetical protein